MMDEKTMVSDTLTGINGELKMYAEYISQSEDPKLKQTLKQMRNKAEAAQEQIYQIARENPIMCLRPSKQRRNRTGEITV